MVDSTDRMLSWAWTFIPKKRRKMEKEGSRILCIGFHLVDGEISHKDGLCPL